MRPKYDRNLEKETEKCRIFVGNPAFFMPRPLQTEIFMIYSPVVKIYVNKFDTIAASAAYYISRRN